MEEPQKAIELWCGICIAQMSVQPKLEKEELIEELERIHQMILPYVEDFHDGYGLVQMFNAEYNLALKGESL